MFLKAIYVENWTYQESPERIKEVDEFLGKVEENQMKFGETEFDWGQSTYDLTAIVLESLNEYMTEGQADKVIAELPEEMKSFFKANLVA
ncbi:MAG: DUF2267 domain-containing protein, partial [Fulvivirga sp.]|nr:DUF2267 domain-containing protein [Fulvivirga sp.]